VADSTRTRSARGRGGGTERRKVRHAQRHGGTMSSQRSSEVRASLGHPVIDGDGHFIELAPMLHDDIVSTLEDLGGTALRDRYVKGAMRLWSQASPDRREYPERSARER
jgi:hypothetical protein